MNTNSRVKSLDLVATLRVEVKEVRMGRKRRFWQRGPKEGSVKLTVEGTPSIWLFSGDVLDINHRVTEGSR